MCLKKRVKKILAKEWDMSRFDIYRSDTFQSEQIALAALAAVEADLKVTIKGFENARTIGDLIKLAGTAVGEKAEYYKGMKGA